MAVLNTAAGDVSLVLSSYKEAPDEVPAWRRRWEELERLGAQRLTGVGPCFVCRKSKKRSKKSKP